MGTDDRPPQDQPPRRKRGRPPHPDILTPREWQVLDLLRQNLTNEQIAQRLDVSPATAKYHVSEIISKLGVSTREEAAAWQPEAVPAHWWAAGLAWVARRAWPLAGVTVLTAVLALGVAALLLRGGDQEQPAVAAPSPSVTLSPPSATATATPTPVPAPLPAGLARLAYIGPDGALWIVAPDGTDNRRLTHQCPGNQIKWSPDGAHIACAYFSIAIFDSQGGEVWRRDHSFDIPGASFLEWAPDGRRLAFRDADRAIHIVHVPDDTDRIVKSEALPLGWVGENMLLVGLNVQDSEGPSAYTYDIHLLNLETGESTSTPYFDGKVFWIAPQGDRAVVQPEFSNEGPGLVVYDFATGVETPVPNTTGIFMRSITFAADGAGFFAASADSGAPTSTIFSCAFDASGCQPLGSVRGLLLTISDEGLVAYLTPGGIPETLHLIDVRTGVTTDIGLAHPNFAWRPTP
jgi:DNA-binding CsgD family transcriptional regulator